MGREGPLTAAYGDDPAQDSVAQHPLDPAAESVAAQQEETLSAPVSDAQHAMGQELPLRAPIEGDVPAPEQRRRGGHDGQDVSVPDEGAHASAAGAEADRMAMSEQGFKQGRGFGVGRGRAVAHTGPIAVFTIEARHIAAYYTTA